MNKAYQQTQDSLNNVAKKLVAMRHPRANEIVRIAQFFGQYGGGGTNIGHDGSQMFQSMADESGADMETTPEGDALNPGISSYVKMKAGEEPVVDDRKTHTCTVIFKAPDGVSEADMMNYILGIGGELGVDVESFKWSKSEARPIKTV